MLRLLIPKVKIEPKRLSTAFRIPVRPKGNKMVHSLPKRKVFKKYAKFLV